MERSNEARANEQPFTPVRRSSTDVEELAALIASVFRLDVRDSRDIATALYPDLEAAA